MDKWERVGISDEIHRAITHSGKECWVFCICNISNALWRSSATLTCINPESLSPPGTWPAHIVHNTEQVNWNNSKCLVKWGPVINSLTLLMKGSCWGGVVLIYTISLSSNLIRQSSQRPGGISEEGSDLFCPSPEIQSSRVLEEAGTLIQTWQVRKFREIWRWTLIVLSCRAMHFTDRAVKSRREQ